MKMTISDIARIAKVSKATVSRVINNSSTGVSEQTRENILAIIKEVGYSPNQLARSIVTSKSKTIGLIIPDITNPFFPKLVRGVEDYALSKDYTVFLCNSDGDAEKEKQYLANFIAKRVDGIILTATESKDDRINHLLENYNGPVVLLDRQITSIKSDATVISNNKKGGYMAVSHLIQEGYKNIAFLGGLEKLETTQHRYKGYLKAHKQYGMLPQKDRIMYGEYTVESGERMTKKLLELGVEFDGIFAGCDLIAIGAIKVLKKQGIKVPQDVGVVGFDDIYMSELFEPALTTIAQDAYKMGAKVTEALNDLINGEICNKRAIIIEPKLIIRESSKGGRS